MKDNGILSETPGHPAPVDMKFTYDPANPVPTYGGSNLEIKCGPLDQRVVEARDDVLTFTTAALTSPVRVVGALKARLFVSSANVNDTDWTAKLSDVYPDGSSHLLNDG